MSEHSIKELEDQLQSAIGRQTQANVAVRDAQDRLQAARNEDSGLVGHVLEYTVRQGFGRTEKHIKRRLLVKNVKKGWNDTLYAYGSLIVANGTVGLRGDHVDVSKATDAGPYVVTP